MTSIPISVFSQNAAQYVAHAVNSQDVISVTTEKGSAILLSEEEFDAIKNTQSQPAAQEPKKTLVEQMAEYKQLLDMGVITQEEFDAKKRQILKL